jgi:2-polyprenyl-6-methoxyphenol hydroxylase-like FAD-dependent oxidoreductase
VTERNTVETVAIIGAGIGGIYLAAQLGIAGFKPRFHDIVDSKLSEIRARGGLEVDGERVPDASRMVKATDFMRRG